MLRAVLIEDDKHTCELVTIVFERSGIKVVATAGDGIKGLDALKEHLPDFAVCDLKMPRMSGIEMCIAARKDPLLVNMPLFALTAAVEESNQKEARAAGFNDFFTKPFDLMGLVAAVKRHVSPTG